MRKLIVHEFVTLDGIMQAPGGVDEDRDGGFAHGGWTLPYWHDDLGATFGPLMQGLDAFPPGRRTYDPRGVVLVAAARRATWPRRRCMAITVAPRCSRSTSTSVPYAATWTARSPHGDPVRRSRRSCAATSTPSRTATRSAS